MAWSYVRLAFPNLVDTDPPNRDAFPTDASKNTARVMYLSKAKQGKIHSLNQSRAGRPKTRAVMTNLTNEYDHF